MEAHSIVGPARSRRPPSHGTCRVMCIVSGWRVEGRDGRAPSSLAGCRLTAWDWPARSGSRRRHARGWTPGLCPPPASFLAADRWPRICWASEPRPFHVCRARIDHLTVSHLRGLLGEWPAGTHLLAGCISPARSISTTPAHPGRLWLLQVQHRPSSSLLPAPLFAASRRSLYVEHLHTCIQFLGPDAPDSRRDPRGQIGAAPLRVPWRANVHQTERYSSRPLRFRSLRVDVPPKLRGNNFSLQGRAQSEQEACVTPRSPRAEATLRLCSTMAAGSMMLSSSDLTSTCARAARSRIEAARRRALPPPPLASRGGPRRS